MLTESRSRSLPHRPACLYGESQRQHRQMEDLQHTIAFAMALRVPAGRGHSFWADSGFGYVSIGILV